MNCDSISKNQNGSLDERELGTIDLNSIVNDVKSSNQAVKRKALKEISIMLTSVKPSVCSLINALRRSNLFAALYFVIEHDGSEMCRENAALALKSIIQNISKSVSIFMDAKSLEFDGDDQNSKGHNGTITLKEISACLQKEWTKFCPMVQTRFLALTTEKSKLGLKDLCVGSACAEPAEEIRLILIQTAREQLKIISTLWKYSQSDKLGWKESTTSLKTKVSEDTTFLEASSLLVQALYLSILYDPYPELKREGCYVIIKLGEVIPVVIRMHAERLLVPLCGGTNKTKSKRNLQQSSKTSQTRLISHRHAKTRCLALEASASVVERYAHCNGSHEESKYIGEDDTLKLYQMSSHFKGNEFTQSVHPIESILHTHVFSGWDVCAFDKVSSVRTTLMKVVGKTIQLCWKDDFTANVSTSKLLIFLLDGMSSESIDVSKAAKEELRKCSLVHITSTLETKDTKTISAYEIEMNLVKIIQLHFTLILAILIEYTASWSLDRKLQGLRTFKTLLQLAISLHPNTSLMSESPLETNSSISVTEMTSVLYSLSLNFADDEISVKQGAASCSELLGRNLRVMNDICYILLPQISGKGLQSSSFPPFSTPKQFASALTLLGYILKGSKDTFSKRRGEKEINLATRIAKTIACKPVLDLSWDGEVMWSLLHCCQGFLMSLSFSLTRKDDGSNNTATLNLLACCLHMLGCPDEFGLKENVKEFLSDLSKMNPYIGRDGDVFQTYFRSLMETFFKDSMGNIILVCNGRDSQSPTFLAFRALLEFSDGTTVGENFDLISQIFEKHLFSSLKEKDTFESSTIIYKEKLHTMALFESTISDPKFPNSCLHPFAIGLLQTAIIPNLVWRAGALASALRKLTLATLFSLLRAKAALPKTIFETASQLLPLMKSNLTDDESSTRQLTCLSTSMIFDCIPNALDEKAVMELYPSLLKCLDDSNKNVRFAGCEAFTTFFTSAPASHFGGGIYSNIVQELLIHMDDPDSRMQEAVLNLLISSMSISKETLAKKVLEARPSHRSTKYCDQLLDHACDDFA